MGESVKVSRKAIVEELPVGMLVFMIQNAELKIVTINDRLVKFANSVRSNVEDTEKKEWNKKRLMQMFSKNIYVFAVDEDTEIVRNLVKEATSYGFSQKIFRLRGTEGENTRWIHSSCSSRKLDDNTRVYYVVFMDFTGQMLHEQRLLDKQKELEEISQYDSLTNVCNRYSYNRFMDRSKAVFIQGAGIAFADINGLKDANDEFGHQFGDRLIMEFVEIMLHYFDHSEIFRISGDEFVIIKENIPVEEFEGRMKSILRETSEDNIVSIGYKWESTVVDLKHSIYQAEQLMMIQKQKYYMAENSVLHRHRPQILKGLLEDLGQERYIVYLQPKAKMNTTEVTGAEALIRKVGRDGSIIPPYEFVPVLEKELLISQIDFFVLEEVCKLIHKWKSEGKRLIRISVNMSRVTMAGADFLEGVKQICDNYQVDYGNIEIEITESTDTKDDRKLAEIVEELSTLGFGVSLDDMGNDYSSLKMVTMKGIDTIKIDRGLVLQMQSDEGIALIRYVIALCHEIGKKCIAEGVEDDDQASVLADMGCDYYQGYLLDRPIPMDEFEKYL